MWEIFIESKFRIMVYFWIWICGDMIVFNFFYGKMFNFNLCIYKKKVKWCCVFGNGDIGLN